MGEFERVVVIYLFVINIITFLLFFIDKVKAKKNAWRVSERVLLFSVILGGSVGAFAGMYTFRHKTRHSLFRLGVPFILIMQIIGVWYFVNHFTV